MIKMSNGIQKGSCIRFDYRGEARTIEVEAVRNVGGVKKNDPVREMVTGFDLAKKGFRNFYREEMENLTWVTQ
jgi:hypothetical protein